MALAMQVSIHSGQTLVDTGQQVNTKALTPAARDIGHDARAPGNWWRKYSAPAELWDHDGGMPRELNRLAYETQTLVDALGAPNYQDEAEADAQRIQRHVRPDVGGPAASAQGSVKITPRVDDSYKPNHLFRFFKYLSKRAVKCVCCLEEYPSTELITLKCKHKYCKSCTHQLATTALHDDSLFPPRCCTHKIRKSVIRKVLTSSEQETYDAKVRENAVPWDTRLYCPRASCGAFIPPSPHETAAGVRPCPRCGVHVCKHCRQYAHKSGQDCQEDAGLQEVLEQAKANGWMRCYNCRAMVELTWGCKHMTCRCKAQFCYYCGTKWKMCDCSWIDFRPDNLLVLEFREPGLRANNDEPTRTDAARTVRFRRPPRCVTRPLPPTWRTWLAARAAKSKLVKRLAEERYRVGEKYTELVAALERFHRLQKESMEERHSQEASQYGSSGAGQQTAQEAKPVTGIHTGETPKAEVLERHAAEIEWFNAIVKERDLWVDSSFSPQHHKKYQI